MLTTILLGTAIGLSLLVGLMAYVFVEVYFIKGKEFEDEGFKWKYKYEFVFGRGGVYGFRKVYIFMGTK